MATMADAHRLRHIPEEGKHYTKTLTADLMGVSTQNRHKNGLLQEMATKPTRALLTLSLPDTQCLPVSCGSLWRSSSESQCVNFKCPYDLQLYKYFFSPWQSRLIFAGKIFPQGTSSLLHKTLLQIWVYKHIKIIYISGIGIGKNKIIVYNQRTI